MEENKYSTTFTSARTLLAILRLATALARLRIVDQVEKEDVNEAMRLMEMSKDSLKQQQAVTNRGKKDVDVIYDLIRSIAEGSKTLKVQDIRDRYVDFVHREALLIACILELQPRDSSLTRWRSVSTTTRSSPCGS